MVVGGGDDDEPFLIGFLFVGLIIFVFGLTMFVVLLFACSLMLLLGLFLISDMNDEKLIGLYFLSKIEELNMADVVVIVVGIVVLLLFLLHVVLLCVVLLLGSMLLFSWLLLIVFLLIFVMVLVVML